MVSDSCNGWSLKWQYGNWQLGITNYWYGLLVLNIKNDDFPFGALQLLTGYAHQEVMSLESFYELQEILHFVVHRVQRVQRV